MHQKVLHVLVSPLDWGLGHATRCIPVIRQLLAAGHKVTIAGYGRSLIILQKEFPALEYIELKGFSPSYPKNGKVTLHLLQLLPRFISTILKEHVELKKLINSQPFDIVISDNRYGLWHKNVKSILITHQVMVKTPAWLRIAEYPLYLVSRLMISRFDECWIPDNAGKPGLSGDLSHKYALPRNARFIGPLSRFENSSSKKPGKRMANEILAIISGPEPQRSIFEDILTRQLSQNNWPATLVTGKPETDSITRSAGNLNIISHITSGEMRLLIAGSGLIICRSGYSSLMDLQAIGAKVLFVPTPGQTEQLYLANLHHNEGSALWREQENLDLAVDIDAALNYPGFSSMPVNTGIKAAINGLRKK